MTTARRMTAWRDSLLSRAVATANTGLDSLLGDWTPTDTRSLTLTRMLICLDFMASSPKVADGEQTVDIGIGVASQAAFATGTGSLPDPSLEDATPARGWVYRNRLLVSDRSDEYERPKRITVDIRTKRKLDQGEMFIVVRSTAHSGATFNITYHGLVRSLYLLP